MALKVLMVTMGLDIGGAETHIVELSKELKRRGIDVIIASNGGVYVKELEKCGIRHFNAPMNSRSAKKLLESYRKLRKIIKTEKPDVVHAHARIPALICTLVRKSCKFNFVTTTHGMYKVDAGLKMLTNWGEKSIAVSDDIAKYLLDNYGVSAGDITVTINGIDTEKFSPSVSGEKIIKEFGLNKEKPIITHVSRLDGDSSTAAEQLISIAPDLAKSVSGVQIIIAGGGENFEKFKAKADKINSSLGYKCLIMAGARTDINEVLSVCDLFVGVSRAALEAMAEEKPAAISGNAGFMGLFEEEKLALAKEGNFCGRGCEKAEEKLLLNEILHFFSDISPEKAKCLGSYGRRVVQEHYSVGKMAEDCIKVYDSVVPKKYNVLMSGYYGFNNSGDEAILQTINNNIRKRSSDISITVLSNDPENTKKVYGCDAVARFSLFKVLKAVKKCDVLVSGGGSLLQDRTSTRSLLYYLFIIRMAERMGKKVMFYANGIGPLNKKSNRRRVKKAAERADVVTLRDKNSARELIDLGISSDHVHVTMDPVFTMDPSDETETNSILKKCGVPENEPFMAVSVRFWDGMEGFCEKIADICDKTYEKYGLNIVFVVMQMPNDVAISKKICALMKHKGYVLNMPCTAEQLMGIIGKAKLVLSMRLHSLIFAARMAVPTVGLVYDPKMDYYLEMLEEPSAGRVENLDTDRTEKAIDEVISNREKYAVSLEKKAKIFAEDAVQNEKYLLDLLKND